MIKLKLTYNTSWSISNFWYLYILNFLMNNWNFLVHTMETQLGVCLNVNFQVYVAVIFNIRFRLFQSCPFNQNFLKKKKKNKWTNYLIICRKLKTYFFLTWLTIMSFWYFLMRSSPHMRQLIFLDPFVKTNFNNRYFIFFPTVFGASTW